MIKTLEDGKRLVGYVIFDPKGKVYKKRRSSEWVSLEEASIYGSLATATKNAKNDKKSKSADKRGFLIIVPVYLGGLHTEGEYICYSAEGNAQAAEYMFEAELLKSD